jgi:hypothetical protein
MDHRWHAVPRLRWRVCLAGAAVTATTAVVMVSRQRIGPVTRDGAIDLPGWALNRGKAAVKTARMLGRRSIIRCLAKHTCP